MNSCTCTAVELVMENAIGGGGRSVPPVIDQVTACMHILYSEYLHGLKYMIHTCIMWAHRSSIRTLVPTIYCTCVASQVENED